MIYKNCFSRLFYFTFILISTFFSASSFANKSCEEVFDEMIEELSSTRYLSERVTKGQKEQREGYKPNHIDIKENIEKEVLWNRSPSTPDIMRLVLPDGVQFINHSLPYSPSPSIVRLTEPGVSMIARAQYPYKKETLWTNVIFNRAALFDNTIDPNWPYNPSKEKWLVGETAKAAVLFLHGGGTRTATSSNFTEEINHMSKIGIDGIAMDLPIHGNGPMSIKSIEEHILAMGEFAKKYIPPHVPLFVYGHSFGGVFTEKIMQMSSDKKNPFHPSLKGVIIASPPIQDSSLSTKEMLKDYIDRQHKAREQISELNLPEDNIARNLIRNNKVSLINGIFTSLGLHEIDYSIPEHKGKDYIPALMLMGKYDQLVYMGFEDLFQDYYGKLSNVKSMYFDKEPLLDSKNGELVMVGHLLASYIDQKAKQPIHLKEVTKFILDILNKESNQPITIETLRKDEQRHKKNNLLIQLTQLYSNDLSFRNWINHIKLEESIKDGNIKKERLESQRELATKIERKLLVDYVQEVEKRHWIRSLEEGLTSLMDFVQEHTTKYQLTADQKKRLASLFFQGFEPLDKNGIEKFRQSKSLEEFGSQYANLVQLTHQETIQLSDILTRMESSGGKLRKDELISLLENPSQIPEFFLGKSFRERFGLSKEDKGFLLQTLSQNFHISQKILNEIKEASSLADFVELYSKLNKDINSAELQSLVVKEKIDKTKRRELQKAIFNSDSAEDFRRRYPEAESLSTEKDRLFIVKHLKEIIKINEEDQEIYVPKLEEMYANEKKDFEKDRSDDLDAKYTENIKEIDQYVLQIQDSRQAITSIEKDIRALKERKEELLDVVKNEMYVVEQSFNNPPEELKNLYDKADDLLSKAEKAVHTLYDHSELLIETFLKDKTEMSNDLFQTEITNNEKLQELYKEFEKAHQEFEKARQTAMEEHKKRALNGSLGKQIQESFTQIYSSAEEDNLSLLFKFKEREQAELESRLIKERNKLTEAITDYHKVYSGEKNTSNRETIDKETFSQFSMLPTTKPIDKSDLKKLQDKIKNSNEIKKVIDVWNRQSASNLDPTL